MKEKLKKVVKQTVNVIKSVGSVFYTFTEGAITPGIIAFMIKFWFGGMKPNNPDEIPELEDSPPSVEAFIGVMISMGIINVILQKLYLSRKGQHLAIAKENRHRLEHMRYEIQRCFAEISKENALLKNVRPLQNLLAEQMNTFGKLVKQNLMDVSDEILVQIIDQTRPRMQTSFTTFFLQFNKADITRTYLKPDMVTAFVGNHDVAPALRATGELQQVKFDTRAARNYMFNGFKGWAAIAGLTSFAAVANFGIPVVLAMTIHALLQDLYDLPHGEDIIYAVVCIAFISCVYNGVTCFTNLIAQKKDENSLLVHNANLYDECLNTIDDILVQLQDNARHKKELRDSLNIAENEVTAQPYPFEFKLYRDVRMQNPQALQYHLITDKREEDDFAEDSTLLDNHDKSTNNYGTSSRKYVNLSAI